MKRVILSNDQLTKDLMESEGQDYIFPKQANENYVYFFMNESGYWFIIKTKENQYRVVSILVKEPYCKKYFKELRGAIKHCLKKKEKVFQLNSLHELYYLLKHE